MLEIVLFVHEIVKNVSSFSFVNVEINIWIYLHFQLKNDFLDSYELKIALK